MRALYFNEFGEPSVLRYGEVADPPGAPGEAIVRLGAIGLNFADVYRRRGNYHLEGDPPYLLGYEGAGVVERADSSELFPAGTRVAFADVPFANAELVAAPTDRLVALPDDVSLETAAGLLLHSADERRERSAQLFAWLRSGKLRPQPPRCFPLSEGAEAHRFLESRQSTGKILLLP